MNALAEVAMGLDPALLFSHATGAEPDEWQAKILRSDAQQLLLNCSRQAGKTSVAATLALHTALYQPGSLTVCASPTLRQAGELLRRVLDLFTALGRPAPVAAESALRLELGSGSRIIALPGKEATVRGLAGVALLIIDEASRVPDSLYYTTRPMLAISGGRLVVLSTPFGKRGFFYEEWTGNGPWEKYRVTARDVPRITPEFLDEECRAMGPRWFSQEYEASFEDAVGQVFASADIYAAVSADSKPLLVG